MKTIYRHMSNTQERNFLSPRQRGTVALKIPTYLKTMLTAQFRTGQVEPITINLGLSLCHKEDMFNKKIGRELAESRMKDVNFELIGINTSSKDYIDYTIRSVLGDAELDLIFREYRDSMNIRLVSAFSLSKSLWKDY